MLAAHDFQQVLGAENMPLYILESLTLMVTEYCEHSSPQALRGMLTALSQLYEPYGECERIRENPCPFAYVAHLRLLLVTYLVTLPLAIVEQMGFSTIPVFWVICYSLMSLEMLAVDGTSPMSQRTAVQ